MTYYELFSSLEVVAVNDAALAVKLGMDGWTDPHGAMAKHCATSAFRMAKRLQGLREWMRHGATAPGLDAVIEYVR